MACASYCYCRGRTQLPCNRLLRVPASICKEYSVSSQERTTARLKLGCFYSHQMPFSASDVSVQNWGRRMYAKREYGMLPTW
jgi:hypothetical protein